MQDSLSSEAVLDAVISALVKMRAGIASTDITASTPLWAFDENGEEPLDLDSLDILEVVFELEDSLGLVFQEGDAGTLYTVGDLANSLAQSEVARAGR
jgi:acyl carrier protein